MSPTRLTFLITSAFLDGFSSKKRLVILGIFAILLLNACAGLPPVQRTPLPSLTPTATPPTLTPTVTPVWFPATSTPTLIPTQPIQAPPPTPDLQPGRGDLLLEDDFSDSAPWTLRQAAGGAATFSKQTLSLTISHKRAYTWGVRLSPILGDFYAEITANPVLCRGLDEYGLIVRAASLEDYYLFSLSCDGQVRFDRVRGGGVEPRLLWQPVPGVPIGGPAQVRLGIWAYRSEMRFFANDRLIFTIKDPVIFRGGLGVYARSASDESVTINFFDLSAWEINPAAFPTSTPTYTPTPKPTALP